MIYIYLSFVLFLFVFPVWRKVYKRKHNKNKVVQVIDDNCARCRNCLQKCHHGVLEMVNTEKGTRIVVVNPQQCTGCGDCVGACNFNALVLVDRVQHKN